MSTSDSLRKRIGRFVATERISLLIAAAMFVVAVVAGVVMGAVPFFVALVILIVAAAFALMAWRKRRGQVSGSSVGGALANFAIATVAVLLAIQLVPYGRSHSNPPVLGEPAWASEETREIMVNSCFGCHSNEVVWPWYSNIAPISWLVTRHVDEGREHVNYSEFSVDRGDADETIEVIKGGSMPPSYYTLFGLHPEAKLTDADLQTLINGLLQTEGMSENR